MKTRERESGKRPFRRYTLKYLKKILLTSVLLTPNFLIKSTRVLRGNLVPRVYTRQSNKKKIRDY